MTSYVNEGKETPQQVRGLPFTSTNPATGEVLWQGSAASAADVDAAVERARAAFEGWAALPVSLRVAIIERFGREVETNHDDLARAISREMGKALWDSKAEVSAVLGKISISLDAYRERTGLKSLEKDGIRTTLRHKPHGVMAVYAPYNFPVHLPNGHMVPALIAGNVVILKPSELTPLCGEMLMGCWQRAGIPDGVVQLVQGARDTGVALAAHDGIDGILFTGSVATGKALHRQMAGKIEKMLALELGGNNPLVVWDVKNIRAAALLIVQSAFITTGQRCTCARRLIVPEGAAGDAIISELVALTRNLVIGAFDSRPEPFMGPLVSSAAAAHAIASQNALIEQGAKPLLLIAQKATDSAFVTPGILDVSPLVSPHPNHLPKGEGVPDEEIFAPLLTVYRAGTMSEAVARANATQYGLAAGIISDNYEHIQYFAQHIRAGIVAINRPTTGASSAMPFGGIGISGNHRPGAYYAADYCAWPLATQESAEVVEPKVLLPGIVVDAT